MCLRTEGNYKDAIIDFEFLKRYDYYNKTELWSYLSHCYFEIGEKEKGFQLLYELLFKMNYNKKELTEYYNHNCK
jgi:hypothetical protein